MSFPRIIAPVIVLSLIFTFLFLTGDKGIPMAAEKNEAIQRLSNFNVYLYPEDNTGHPLMVVIVLNHKIEI